MNEPASETSGGPLVSIIIVLFNSAEYIGPCMDSLVRLEYHPFEVILVDNASDDDSVRVARERAKAGNLECLISELPRNRGFAAANNHGFSLSSGEIVMLLNPDTEIYPDAVSGVVSAMEGDETIGAVGCKLYFPDRRTLQHAGGFIRDNGLTMHYGTEKPDEGQYDVQAEVAYVTGAAMAVRRGLFVEAGMLDEDYFPAYFEETDFCLRVRRMGYRVVYVPSARVVHHEATTTGKYTAEYLYLYHKNRVRFLLKNYSWSFLLNRTLPFEEKWVGWIPEKEIVPLNRAYLANILNLPRTLLSRRAMERRIQAPRIEDTVNIEQTMAEIGITEEEDAGDH